MKKTSFILLCLSFYYGFSQNTEALKLVELLHDKKIEQTLESVKTMSLDTLKIDDQVKELKTNLSEIYNKEYTYEEIQSLITFYKSPTGKKMLEFQQSTNSKVIDKLYKWEAKTQGIELIEETEALAVIESSIDIIDIEKQAVKKQSVPVLPKINTLEDLKKLIQKDVNVIHDTQLLAKLLGLEKLINPALEVEEILPEIDNEKKN